MKTAEQIAEELEKHKPIDGMGMYDEKWEDWIRGSKVTNGENLKNIYPDLEIIREIEDVYVIMLETHNVCLPKLEVFKSWWNTEYKEKCTWIKYDYRTMCPKEHDVDNPYWRIPENRMEVLKYCPYCGKEIEVEECQEKKQ